jgi:hypothetical protein
MPFSVMVIFLTIPVGIAFGWFIGTAFGIWWGVIGGLMAWSMMQANLIKHEARRKQADGR